METVNSTITQAKKDFSGLARGASTRMEEIIITKRGKPVAVIVQYEEYIRLKKVGSYRRIMEARETFLKTGLSSYRIFRVSRKELRKILKRVVLGGYVGPNRGVLTVWNKCDKMQ